MGRSRAQQKSLLEGLALNRLIGILQSEDSTNADVFKAITLFCEQFRLDGGSEGAGDIKVSYVGD